MQSNQDVRFCGFGRNNDECFYTEVESVLSDFRFGSNRDGVFFELRQQMFCAWKYNMC